MFRHKTVFTAIDNSNTTICVFDAKVTKTIAIEICCRNARCRNVIIYKISRAKSFFALIEHSQMSVGKEDDFYFPIAIEITRTNAHCIGDRQFHAVLLSMKNFMENIFFLRFRRCKPPKTPYVLLSSGLPRSSKHWQFKLRIIILIWKP